MRVQRLFLATHRRSKLQFSTTGVGGPNGDPPSATRGEKGQGAPSSPIPAPTSSLSPSADGSGGDALMHRNFLAALEQSFATDTNKACTVGHTTTLRFFHNASHQQNPWQASCIEFRKISTADEREDSFNKGGPPRSSPASPSPPANGERSPGPAPPEESVKSPSPTMVELVFYYETSTAEGLAGFRHIARLVFLGLAPGRTENNMSCGFATWVVEKEAYLQMMQSKIPLPE